MVAACEERKLRRKRRGDRVQIALLSVSCSLQIAAATCSPTSSRLLAKCSNFYQLPAFPASALKTRPWFFFCCRFLVFLSHTSHMLRRPPEHFISRHRILHTPPPPPANTERDTLCRQRILVPISCFPFISAKFNALITILVD